MIEKEEKRGNKNMNKEEIEKYKIRDYYVIPVEVIDNIFYSFEQQVKKQKEVINKINKYLNEYDVFKAFSFPLMKRWEEEQIKSSIDYEFKTSLIKDLKDILKEVSDE